ncbi:glycosyl hydrolase family 28-related protein [Fimbriimonas ginsengisoli]|uniref:Rhamnogalacturonase A/B/Epimerase-like pectate lyase domain-containing protein n=1 Tax=Fimbriimonas ginsengisoli Gsoil 348 TaxID=661478 RepID=A0A068NLU0_FIMGI|nr:glycosyl hydrolase family 28-related protein [Fimbriimonas ginsengisoli]AIE83735.1 hypothetical protein OP10G_0367 [Fimbriimonas ginsengisoli Gsoil 348]
MFYALSLLTVLGPATLDVASFGAKGDGRTDNTKAFQAALDAAAKQNVAVFAGSGNYRFAGTLNVPKGVTLKGSWESVPSHNGIRNPDLPKPTDGGTTFLIEGGEGTEAGAFLTLNTNSTVKGVVFYYPKQDPKAIPKPYPWAIAMRGKNPAVLDVELLNPYNGIDASANERHLIRNVSGQPLRRGIFVDAIYDIGRIENVHFNPWWSVSDKLLDWQRTYGEAFIFSRTDWQYVLNTFAFGYGVGYRFMESKDGACNGNFLGIGADDCNVAVKVEQAAPFGLLITNGEFTSFHGASPTQVVVSPANTGVVRFSNCAFWGPCDRIADIAGTGTVGFGDCTFVQWDGRNKGLAAIRATGGSILVRGCEFREDKEHVAIEAGVKRAILTDNLSPKKLRMKIADPSVVKTDAP